MTYMNNNSIRSVSIPKKRQTSLISVGVGVEPRVPELKARLPTEAKCD
ncbi:hypothetical protein GcM3_029026, partial [Golovinomyces cichoracearum]